MPAVGKGSGTDSSSVERLSESLNEAVFLPLWPFPGSWLMSGSPCTWTEQKEERRLRLNSSDHKADSSRLVFLYDQEDDTASVCVL